MRQLTSLLGSGLLFIGAVVAVMTGPYSYRVAPGLSLVIELLALVTLLLTLTGNPEWSPVTGILLLLVMTMPLVGLTPGKTFPAPIPVSDLRSWLPLYVGLGLLAIPGRSLGEVAEKGDSPPGGLRQGCLPVPRLGLRQRIMIELYELSVMVSAVIVGSRVAGSW